MIRSKQSPADAFGYSLKTRAIKMLQFVSTNIGLKWGYEEDGTLILGSEEDARMYGRYARIAYAANKIEKDGDRFLEGYLTGISDFDQELADNILFELELHDFCIDAAKKLAGFESSQSFIHRVAEARNGAHNIEIVSWGEVGGELLDDHYSIAYEQVANKVMGLEDKYFEAYFTGLMDISPDIAFQTLYRLRDRDLSKLSELELTRIVRMVKAKEPVSGNIELPTPVGFENGFGIAARVIRVYEKIGQDAYLCFNQVEDKCESEELKFPDILPEEIKAELGRAELIYNTAKIIDAASNKDLNRYLSSLWDINQGLASEVLFRLGEEVKTGSELNLELAQTLSDEIITEVKDTANLEGGGAAEDIVRVPVM